MTPSPSPSSAVRAAVDELQGLLEKAEVGAWTVAYDHKEGDHSDWDIVWIRGQQGETVAEMGERYTMAPKHAEAMVAALNLAPHLLAAIKAVDELAGDWAERSEDWAEAGKVHRAEGRTLETSRCAARSWAWGEAASEVRAALALAAVDVTETAE